MTPCENQWLRTKDGRTWAANCIGNTDESATRTLLRPYTRRSVSTTPPWESGSMAHVEDGWNSVEIDCATQLSQSSSVLTYVPGYSSEIRAPASGWVCAIDRANFAPARRRTPSVIFLARYHCRLSHKRRLDIPAG